MVEGTNWKGDKSSYTYNGLGIRINNTQTTHAGQMYSRDYVIDYTSYENDDLMVFAYSGESVEYEQKQVYAGSERIEQFTDKGNWERMLYVHEDVMGNTRYYTKENGQSFAELTYDAWGMPESPNKLLNNDHGNFVYATFTGHIYDTTLDIYFAEARFYDAANRTWLAMDPIKDGLNWYQYCYSNPTTYWDPLGLSGWIVEGIGSKFAKVTCEAHQELLKDMLWNELVHYLGMDAGIEWVINEYYIRGGDVDALNDLLITDYIQEHGIQVIDVPNRERQVEFLNSILKGAVEDYLLTGVPWQVTMGQAAQETGWGSSAENAVDIYTGLHSNNLFGIKHPGPYTNRNDYALYWTKEEIEPSEIGYWEEQQEKWAEKGEKLEVIETTASGNMIIQVIQPFRVYPTANDSIKGHSDLLQNDIYSEASQYESDPYAYIESIGERYATDSSYVENVTSIIDRYLDWDTKE